MTLLSLDQSSQHSEHSTPRCTVLFVSPHPDDLELFAGGFLAHHLTRGDLVWIVLVTAGEQGSILGPWGAAGLKKKRLAEFHARCQQLPGLAGTRFLNLPDGKLAHEEHLLRAKLEECLLGLPPPDVVYGPEAKTEAALYGHPDHLAVGRALAAFFPTSPVLRFYHSRHANVFIDLGSFEENTLGPALCSYPSQWGMFALPPFNLLWMALLRKGQLRLWGKECGVRWAEGVREAPEQLAL